MMAALLKYQAKDGMWRQLLDHPEGLGRKLLHRNVYFCHDHGSEERLAR